MLPMLLFEGSAPDAPMAAARLLAVVLVGAAAGAGTRRTRGGYLRPGEALRADAGRSNPPPLVGGLHGRGAPGGAQGQRRVVDTVDGDYARRPHASPPSPVVPMEKMASTSTGSASVMTMGRLGAAAVLHILEAVGALPGGAAPLQDEEDVCRIAGVVCAQDPATGRLMVAALNFPRRNLTGALPERLPDGAAAFTDHVRAVVLFDNALVGPIPAWVATLRRLEILDLCQNRLTGELPRAVGHLPHLQELCVCANRLDGTVPVDFFAPAVRASLRKVYLYGNRFEGPLVDVSGAGRLQELDLSGNRFHGALEAGRLEGLGSLVHLAMEDNRFTGGFDGWCGRAAFLPQLSVLRAGRNRLAGDVAMCLLPRFVATRPMRVVNIRENPGLSGAFPGDGGGAATQVQTLDLGGTAVVLTGSWSPYRELRKLVLDGVAWGQGRAGFEALDALRMLSLRGAAQESGRGAVELLSLPRGLEVLDLADAVTSADVCRGVLAALPALRDVRLDRVPTALCDTPFPAARNLTALSLRGVGGRGRVPARFPPTLQHLDLGENGFDGGVTRAALTDRLPRLRALLLDGAALRTLPQDLFALAVQLERLALNATGLGGRCPALPAGLVSLDLSGNPALQALQAVAGLRHLRVLRLDATAKPPPRVSFGQHAALQVLSLRGVGAGGPVPLSALPESIEVVDLRDNAFEGGLDAGALASLPRLEELRLDNNRLDGEVPRDAFAGNSRLRVATLSGNSGLRGRYPSLPGGVEVLHLHNTALGGDVFPVHLLTRLRRLRELRLDGNSVTAAAAILTVPPVLEVLTLRGCGIAGAIPDLAPAAAALRVVDLSGNAFTKGFDVFGGMKWPQLRVLDVSGNRLGGRVPEGLPQVAELRLDGNGFEGTLPAGLLGESVEVFTAAGNRLDGELVVPEGASELRYLDAGGNRLSSVRPASWRHLKQLVEVRIGGNALRGAVPDVAGLASLRVLHLHDNAWEGPFPETAMAHLPSLESLRLDGNAFTGVLPAGGYWAHFPALEALDLSRNRFVEAPLNFTALAGTLRLLNLSGNALAGPFPSRQMHGLGRLEALDLSWNALDGPLPNITEFWEGLTALRECRLGWNRFRGGLPRLVGAAGTLETLVLAGNELTGEIGDHLASMVNLRALDLSGNRFVGTGAVWPRALGRLESLNLSGNDIAAPLPDLTRMPMLEAVDLHSNRFHGAALEDLGVSVLGAWSYEALRYVDLSRNRLSGEFTPRAVYALRQVEHLALGGNRFDGPLPKELGAHMKHLEVLDLHGNRFAGGIPWSYGHLPALRELDLHANLLNGSFPPSFRHLRTVAVLRLQDNAFEGRIDHDVLAGMASLTDLSLHNNRWFAAERRAAALRAAVDAYSFACFVVWAAGVAPAWPFRQGGASLAVLARRAVLVLLGLLLVFAPHHDVLLAQQGFAPPPTF